MNNNLLDLIWNFLSRSDITSVLAAIGSIGTIVGWIYFLVTTRRNLKIKVLDYRAWHVNVVQFFICFQNQSSSSICISSIDLIYNDFHVCCELIPKKIRGNDDNLIKTPMFPINLASKQGSLYFIEFLIPERIFLNPGNTVVFQINTNRGTIKKSVTLSDTSHYLHNK